MLERTYVCVEDEWVEWDHDKMTFINIEEGVMGQDVLTFEYNGVTYVSEVRGE